MEGFLQAQKAIDFALINQFNSKVDEINMELKRFPYPPYNEDSFIPIIIGMLPFIIELSFIFLVILTAKEIVEEKETGLKEALKLMGLKPWIYWSSWYIKTMIISTPSLILMIICYSLKLPLRNSLISASIIGKTNPVIFGLFIVLYSSSLTTFTMICSCFFKKSNSAAAGSGIIYFMCYLPNIIISLRYERISFYFKVCFAFISNLAMSMGIQLIGMLDIKDGVQFSNIHYGINSEDTFSVAHVLVILIFNHLIHVFLIYYFDNVLPGDHGIAKPWHFVFKRFLKQKSKNNSKEEYLLNSINGHSNTNANAYIEDESIYNKTKKVGIRLEKLNKTYKQMNEYKKAVDNLNLNIYEGQITVLLGKLIFII